MDKIPMSLLLFLKVIFVDFPQLNPLANKVLMMESTSPYTIDCRGMQCPAPIMKIAQTARQHRDHPIAFRVLATDNAFPEDLKAWCRSTKAQIIEIKEESSGIEALVAMQGASDFDPPKKATEKVPSSRGFQPLRNTLQRNQAFVEVDCRGMQCPAPILKVAKQARTLEEGVPGMRILATDPNFEADIEAWCRSTKSYLVGVVQLEKGLWEATINMKSEFPESSVVPISSKPPSSLPKKELFNGAMETNSASSSQSQSSVLNLCGEPSGKAILKLSEVALNCKQRQLTVFGDTTGFAEKVRFWAEATEIKILAEKSIGKRHVFDLDLAPDTPAGRVPHSLTLRNPMEDLDSEKLRIDSVEPVSTTRASVETGVVPRENLATLLVLHNDLESLMAAMMIATSSAAQGMEVTVFFSFWGVNLLRGERKREGLEKEPVSFLQRIMKWMMPKGPSKQKLSKFQFGGVGKGMIEHFIRKNKIMTLEQLVQAACDMNVRFIVCTMSMSIMGIQQQDLMDLPNIEYAGVTSFSELAGRSRFSLAF
jgi:peroxiredoxin family protein/TusA-related sulfurtransferase